ncbi:MAG TPA: site-specific integrase [Solirubrobacterales bacterium]|nr:site-specific integrase [Solirubrobacterales bacterium]
MATPSGRRGIASAAEAAALLAALPADDRPVWATAFYAGLRRGELQALRVCDIDLAGNLIAVERGWDQVEGVIEPKSRAGSRGVPLLSILRGYLDGHLRRSGRSGEDLVFGRTTVEAFYAATVDGRAKRAWRKANERERAAAQEAGSEPVLLDPITLHHCRHTFASLLIDSGANPKAIQEFMGHSKIETTFDVYGHLSQAAATRCGGAWMSISKTYQKHATHDLVSVAGEMSSWSARQALKQAQRNLDAAVKTPRRCGQEAIDSGKRSHQTGRTRCEVQVRFPGTQLPPPG